MPNELDAKELEKLTLELTKYAEEGASDEDMRVFRESYISEIKKKSTKNTPSTPTLSDIGQPFTSTVQTPLVKPSPLASNSKSVSEVKPTANKVNPLATPIQTLPSENTAVNTINTYDTNQAREERKQKLGGYTTDLMDYIGKNSQDFTKKGGLSQKGYEPEGQPNVDNIRNLVETYAEKQLKENKVELSSFDKQYLVNNLAEQVKNKKTVQEALINTNLKLRNKYGYDLTDFTGVKDQKGNVITKGTFDKAAEQINNEQSKILQSYKEKVTTLNDQVSNEIKPALVGLESEYKIQGEKLGQDFNQAVQSNAEPKIKELNSHFNQLVESGQMTTEQANQEYQIQANQIYKDTQNVLTPQFEAKFSELTKSANDKSKLIQGEYNRKYLAQVQREKQNAELKLKEIVSKYGTDIPKEFLNDYEQISRKELEKTFKANAEKAYQEARNTDLTTRLDKALKAGFGDVLGSIGGAISYVTAESSGVNDAVIKSTIQNELPSGYFADKSLTDKFTNSQWWIDNGVRSIPFILATMPVGIAAGTGVGAFARLLNASKKAQMISGAVGGGAVSWYGENLLETGSAFKEAIDSGMSEKDASAIAANTFRNNLATLPLNVVQMMPIFSKSFKFLQASAVEGVAGGLEEVLQGWSQAQAKAEAMGQDVTLFEYFKSDQAKEEGVIGATMGQSMAMLSLKNTQDIDKQIATIMSSVGTGGEQYARSALEIMNKSGVLSDTDFQEANALIDYTMKGIEQVQGIKVDDTLKAVLVGKYAKIGRAKALMSDDENDLVSQAAKEIITEQEKEIKEILKGTTPIYLVFEKGQDVPISTTKEELISILKDKNLREQFKVQAINDDKWQAQIDKVYGTTPIVQNKPIETSLNEQNVENKSENLVSNEQADLETRKQALKDLMKATGVDIYEIAVADGSFNGEGFLDMDTDGNVVLTRFANTEENLTKGGKVLDPQELEKGANSMSNTAVATSAVEGGVESYAKKDGVVGKYKIPFEEMVKLMKEGYVYFAGVGNKEFVLSPHIAQQYLTTINGKEVSKNENAVSEVKTNEEKKTETPQESKTTTTPSSDSDNKVSAPSSIEKIEPPVVEQTATDVGGVKTPSVSNEVDIETQKRDTLVNDLSAYNKLTSAAKKSVRGSNALNKIKSKAEALGLTIRENKNKIEVVNTNGKKLVKSRSVEEVTEPTPEARENFKKLFKEGVITPSLVSETLEPTQIRAAIEAFKSGKETKDVKRLMNELAELQGDTDVNYREYDQATKSWVNYTVPLSDIITQEVDVENLSEKELKELDDAFDEMFTNIDTETETQLTNYFYENQEPETRQQNKSENRSSNPSSETKKSESRQPNPKVVEVVAKALEAEFTEKGDLIKSAAVRTQMRKSAINEAKSELSKSEAVALETIMANYEEIRRQLWNNGENGKISKMNCKW